MTDADSIENSKELLHQPKKFVIIFALFLQVSGVGTWNLYSLLESRQGQQLRLAATLAARLPHPRAMASIICGLLLSAHFKFLAFDMVPADPDLIC